MSPVILKGDYVHVREYEVHGWVDSIDPNGYVNVKFENSRGVLCVHETSLEVLPRERAVPHNIPLGALVQTEVCTKLYRMTPEGEVDAGVLKGEIEYVVVERYRDVDGTPLYNLALDPIEPPVEALERMEFFRFPNLMGIAEPELYRLPNTEPLKLHRY